MCSEEYNVMSMFFVFRWIHDYQDACVDKLELFLRTGQQEPMPVSPGSLPTSKSPSSSKSPPPIRKSESPTNGYYNNATN